MIWEGECRWRQICVSACAEIGIQPCENPQRWAAFWGWRISSEEYRRWPVHRLGVRQSHRLSEEENDQSDPCSPANHPGSTHSLPPDSIVPALSVLIKFGCVYRLQKSSFYRGRCTKTGQCHRRSAGPAQCRRNRDRCAPGGGSPQCALVVGTSPICPRRCEGVVALPAYSGGWCVWSRLKKGG